MGFFSRPSWDRFFYPLVSRGERMIKGKVGPAPAFQQSHLSYTYLCLYLGAYLHFMTLMYLCRLLFAFQAFQPRLTMECFCPHA